MTIHIEALTFDVIIGLLDFERDRPQKVIIDLEASYIYKDGVYVNYADIVSLMQNDLKNQRYELLEEALLGLKSALCIAYPQLKTLSIKISKPDILPQCSVSLSNSWTF